MQSSISGMVSWWSFFAGVVVLQSDSPLLSGSWAKEIVRSAPVRRNVFTEKRLIGYQGEVVTDSKDKKVAATWLPLLVSLL